MKIIKLYGMAFHLYTKSCRFLAQQTKLHSGGVITIKIED
jgi:hypothetical protein